MLLQSQLSIQPHTLPKVVARRAIKTLAKCSDAIFQFLIHIINQAFYQ